MDGAVVWGCSLVGAAYLACAPMRPPSLDPSGLADPSMAASDEPTRLEVAPVAVTGSVEASARIPRAIQATADGFMVLTQDRNFVAVKLP
jgi:hypothetical protein